jgi:hypothetical protein
MSEKDTPIEWTDAPAGTAGHVQGNLVCQIRKLGTGGWSAQWSNGMRWDVKDILPMSGLKSQTSRPFKRRDSAKAAVVRALATGAGLASSGKVPP